MKSPFAIPACAAGNGVGRDLLHVADVVCLMAGVGARPKPAAWISRRMGARIDLADKEALYAALDRKAPPAGREDDS